MSRRLVRSLSSTLHSNSIASQLRASVSDWTAGQSRCCRAWQIPADRSACQRPMQSAAAWLPAPGSHVTVLSAQPASRSSVPSSNGADSRPLHWISLQPPMLQPRVATALSSAVFRGSSAAAGLSCQTVVCGSRSYSKRVRTSAVTLVYSRHSHGDGAIPQFPSSSVRSYALWSGRKSEDDDRWVV